MADTEQKIEATPRETMFLVCLSQSYELAGRKVSDSTIVSAAKEMAARIPCDNREIRELFATAREIGDIPTLKTLWKAWDIINENRVVVPSNTIAYDAESRLVRRINEMETLRIYAWNIGRYQDMCEAYCKQKVGCGKYEYKKPNLKYQFDSEVLPELQRMCGEWWGLNPNLPQHPVRKLMGRK